MDNQFDYQVVSFLPELLVYHSGSGMTHLLKGDLAQIFQIFLQQPSKTFRSDEIEKRVDSHQDLSVLLNMLQRKDMLIQKLD